MMKDYLDIKEEVLVDKIAAVKEQMDLCTDKDVRAHLIEIRAKHLRELYRLIERKERYLRYGGSSR
ncbi:hypothetical protein SAGEFAYGE_23 [Bacillus phage SageFayge]|uniref:WAC domain-containing protein n=1 Tax=Bacillus phage SageFayge TaxID=1805954 RepID=A0A143FNA8_9CAUD|nr:hypothetical protein BI007_gp018 [Bacillus phage DIGNKC]YP_009280826.1 hypothetical protein SAGEFAYGE_23 [Bacillus phage SageFayge]AMW62910.1 hypothetical protein DIGNKC_18 [Bacillus phage DIGNKC]AMW62944.1 hypothetical protein SAGEFAYGE_23 [Bacillus phage SageFayge]UGO46560.1 hypothetical protein ABINADI_243 [Bacillus phage vB_BanH_Abinadi]